MWKKIRILIKQIALTISRWTLRWLVNVPATRKIVNYLYNQKNDQERHRFWRRYAKMYRGHKPSASPGVWSIKFNDISLAIPLSKEKMWLDWDTAVSIYGHDLEVKNTYLKFLKSQSRPDIFVDAGANYGTHSLILRKHGIPTISFEPNPECKKQFQRLCLANKVDDSLEEVALGSEENHVQLAYDSRDTWCGKIVTSSTYKNEQALVTKVKQVPLDKYIDAKKFQNILVKIDVEGHEVEVFKGATLLIAQKNTFFVFESNKSSNQRYDVYDFLSGKDYAIYSLPFDPDKTNRPLSLRLFELSTDNNFIAAPLENGRNKYSGARR